MDVNLRNLRKNRIFTKEQSAVHGALLRGTPK